MCWRAVDDVVYQRSEGSIRTPTAKSPRCHSMSTLDGKVESRQCVTQEHSYLGGALNIGRADDGLVA